MITKTEMTTSALNLIATQSQTIDSQHLLQMVNEARKKCSEKPIRNNDFIGRIKDELDGGVLRNFRNTFWQFWRPAR